MVEVDVLPPQSAQLAAAQADDHCQPDKQAPIWPFHASSRILAASSVGGLGLQWGWMVDRRTQRHTPAAASGNRTPDLRITSESRL
jgi:hypothetical protein